MLSSDETIDHGTLSRLVDAGVTISAEVVGCAGGWGIVINYDRASQTLALTRGAPRIFRKFETLASYLKELGITDLRVYTAGFEACTVDRPSEKRRERASDRVKWAHQVDAYGKWFRSQVQASIDDPRPNVPDAEVRATFARKREALRGRATGVVQPKSSTAAKSPKDAKPRTQAS